MVTSDLQEETVQPFIVIWAPAWSKTPDPLVLTIVQPATVTCPELRSDTPVPLLDDVPPIIVARRVSITQMPCGCPLIAQFAMVA